MSEAKTRHRIGAAALLATLAFLGCHREADRPPPPAAQRPVLKTESELAAERQHRIAMGEVVPNPSPRLEEPSRPAVRRHVPPTTQPAPGAIRADLLMVNDQVLSVADVMYLLRTDLEEARKTSAGPALHDRVRRLVRTETQRQVGSLLIFGEALASLEDQQRDAIEKAVDKKLDELKDQEFGGSKARLAAFAAEVGLTMEQFRTGLKRELVVREYTREKLMPLIHIRRDELLAEYQRNLSQYETPAARELLMIEFPFAAYLPPGTTWEQADRNARATARLAAADAARQAHAALAERPLAEVADEYGRGLHAHDGGSWGLIGRPLQRPPLDEVTARIFEFSEGQYSEPLETGVGWYIVQCGRIQVGARRSFEEVQGELRQELMERRFTRESTEYVLKLAERATITGLDGFIDAAVNRALTQPPPATVKP